MEKANSSTSLRMELRLGQASVWLRLQAHAVETRKDPAIHPHIPNMHRGDMKGPAEIKHQGRFKHDQSFNVFPYPHTDTLAEDGSFTGSRYLSTTFVQLLADIRLYRHRSEP